MSEEVKRYGLVCTDMFDYNYNDRVTFALSLFQR